MRFMPLEVQRLEKVPPSLLDDGLGWAAVPHGIVTFLALHRRTPVSYTSRSTVPMSHTHVVHEASEQQTKRAFC